MFKFSDYSTLLASSQLRTYRFQQVVTRDTVVITRDTVGVVTRDTPVLVITREDTGRSGGSVGSSKYIDELVVRIAYSSNIL